MPFTKHVIQPINIAQCPIPNTERNELECLSNLTLANIIRQLSSLGEHADRVFSELIQDAVNIGIRTKNVTDKVENVRVKISHLDIQTEEG
jgi:WAS family protein 1